MPQELPHQAWHQSEPPAPYTAAEILETSDLLLRMPGFRCSTVGIVVIETVFAYPGLGRLVVFSIQNRDLPTLQASMLVVAAIYALANLIADLLYARLNPKIRYGGNVG